ncbi:uncharacterized protein VP01_10035g1, partial [Puccinia sorghi]
QESSKLQDYIAENVAKGFLRPSKSNTGSPVLFVPKKDECLPCSSYVSFTYALSWSKLFFEAQYLRSLHLQPDLNCQRPGMADCNENPVWKFRVYCNAFWALQCSFDLSKFLLKLLRENSLYAKLSNCEFHNSSLQFLGVIFAYKGIRMDPAKSKQVLDFPKPTSVKTLQGFLGFANFYQEFIKHYLKIIIHLPPSLCVALESMRNEGVNVA